MLTGLIAEAYSQAWSHYRLARTLLPAPFGAWADTDLIINLENSDSSVFPILMPDLARAPAQHRTSTLRNPDLKPSKPQLALLAAAITGTRHCARRLPGCTNWKSFGVLSYILTISKFVFFTYLLYNTHQVFSL